MCRQKSEVFSSKQSFIVPKNQGGDTFLYERKDTIVRNISHY